MRCSHCRNLRGGAYVDYCKGFSFNLCYDCCLELGFFPICLNSLKKCKECGRFFTPKAEWQKNCTDCWIKAQPKKKKYNPKKITFSKLPIQRTLNGVIPNGTNH